MKGKIQCPALTGMLLAMLIVAVHSASSAEYVPRVEFGARLEPHNRIILGAGQDAARFYSYRRLFDDRHQPFLYLTYVGFLIPVDPVVACGPPLQHVHHAL